MSEFSERLTLSAVCGGELETAFQLLQGDIVSAFREQLDEPSSRVVKSKVTLQVEFRLDVVTGKVTVTCSAKGSAPFPRRDHEVGWDKAGFTTDPMDDPRQVAMFVTGGLAASGEES